MKILIIEDEKLLAESLKTLLESKGFDVETVYDGVTGKEYAQLGVYDLLILDVMLPGLNGCQLAKQIRASRCGTPILMLTAKSSLEDRIEGLNAGADYYLTKPFDAREFEVMRYLLQNPERNLSKEMILAHVWGYDSNAVENHVEVYVGFLRKKLTSIGSDISIVAIRRLGYHLEVHKSC